MVCQDAIFLFCIDRYTAAESSTCLTVAEWIEKSNSAKKPPVVYSASPLSICTTMAPQYRPTDFKIAVVDLGALKLCSTRWLTTEIAPLQNIFPFRCQASV